MRKVRPLFLLSILIFLSAFYIVLTSYPRYLDVNYYKNPIEKALADFAGMPVSLGHIEVSFHDGLSLVVEDLSFSGKDPAISVSVKRSAILFKVVPLLKKRRFVVKSIRLFSPEIKVEIEKGVKQHFSRGFPLTGLIDDTGDGKKKLFHRLFTSITAAGIDIFNGKLYLSLPGHSARLPKTFLLDGFSFYSRPDKSKLFVKMKSGFNIFFNGSTARIQVSGRVIKSGKGMPRFDGRLAASSLSLKLIQPYVSFPLHAFNPDAGLDIMAAVETDFLSNISMKGVIKEGRVLGLTGAAPAHIKRPREELPASLSFDIRREGELVDIASVRLTGKGYSLIGSGHIRGVLESDPYIDIQIKSSEIDVSEVKKRIPENLFGEKIDQFLNKNVFGGLVKLTKAHYSGNYNSLLKPLEVETLEKMLLIVELKESGTSLPAPFEKVEKLSGVVRLEKGDLFLNNASLTYKNCDFKNMDISLKNILTSKVLSVSLNGNIDLSEIKPLAGNLLSSSRLASIDSPSGNAFLILKATGTIGVDDSMKYEGKVNLIDAGFQYKGLPVPVQSLNGSIFFSESHVELDRIEWEMGGGHFGVDGAIDGLRGVDPDFDLWLEAGLDAENVKNFGISIPEALLLKRGPAALSLSLKSSEKGVLLNGDLDLTEVNYLYRGFKEKGAAIYNKISFSGLYEEKLLTLNRGRVDLGGSHIDISGVIPFSGDRLPELQVTSDRIKPEDLARIFQNLRSDANGNISLGLEVKGESPFSYKQDLSAQVGINNASFFVGKKGVPLRNITGKLDYFHNRLAFKKLFFQFDEGNITAKGFIKGFPKPDLMVDIEADKLNLNTLFPPKKNNIKDKTKEKSSAAKKRSFGEFKGKVEVGEGLYRNIAFNRTKMFLSINKAGVSAKPFSVKGFKGNFTGAWEFSKRPKKSFSIEGNFKGIDMVALEKTMKIGLSDLEGTGDAKVSLTGSGEGSKEFKETLNGDISLKIKDGRLHKLSILSKIFSLLNLQVLNISSNGMSFESITADIKIKNGVIETKNFLLDSNSFRMTGVGKIDLAKSRIDMLVGVQPFQTLDKVISHIPLIGQVLTGKKKSLIVSYYSVKGDLKKPEIDARAVESVGKGVLGILKRVITLPRDLITGGEE